MKNVTKLLLLLVATLMFASCSKDKITKPDLTEATVGMDTSSTETTIDP